MNLTQAIRAVRALEVRVAELEARIEAMDKPKEKRPYNRKTPNDAMSPESSCPSSPMNN